MTNLDEKLKQMAREEDTPVPEGFDERLEARLLSLPGGRRRLGRRAKIAILAACLCVAVVGTAFGARAVQSIWDYVNREFPDYQGQPGALLSELAEEGLRAGGGQTGYYRKEIDSLAQFKAYLPLLENPWLEGDTFQFEQGQVRVIYDRSRQDGTLSSAGIHAQGTIQGYPFQISVNIFYGDWMRLGYAAIGTPEPPELSEYAMDVGIRAVLWVRESSIKAEFEAEGMVYSLSLEGPRETVEPLFKEILDDFG